MLDPHTIAFDSQVSTIFHILATAISYELMSASIQGTADIQMGDPSSVSLHDQLVGDSQPQNACQFEVYNLRSR